MLALSSSKSFGALINYWMLLFNMFLVSFAHRLPPGTNETAGNSKLDEKKKNLSEKRKHSVKSIFKKSSGRQRLSATVSLFAILIIIMQKYGCYKKLIYLKTLLTIVSNI